MQDKLGYLYSARAGDYVKIGFTTDSKRRIRELKCGRDGTSLNPSGVTSENMQMEGQLFGPKAQELEFHKTFRYDCIPGTHEWYPAEGQAHIAFRNLPGFTWIPTQNELAAVLCSDCGMPTNRKAILCIACRDFRKAFLPNRYGEYA